MEYFVDGASGSDSNPGSLAEPFATIGHGLGVLAAGDILNLRAGTYDEAIDESMLVTGSVGSPITIQNYLGETVTLQPTAACKVLRLETSARSYLIFRGLIFDQSLATCTTEPVISIDANQDHITLDDCEIENGAANGVELAGSGHSISNLEIHDCAGKGLYAAVDDHTFDGIDSHDNGGDGIFIAGNNNVISRCAAHANGGDGIVAS